MSECAGNRISCVEKGKYLFAEKQGVMREKDFVSLKCQSEAELMGLEVQCFLVHTGEEQPGSSQLGLPEGHTPLRSASRILPLLSQIKDVLYVIPQGERRASGMCALYKSRTHADHL